MSTGGRPEGRNDPIGDGWFAPGSRWCRLELVARVYPAGASGVKMYICGVWNRAVMGVSGGRKIVVSMVAMLARWAQCPHNESLLEVALSEKLEALLEREGKGRL